MRYAFALLPEEKLKDAMSMVRRGRGAVEVLTIDEVNRVVEELHARRTMGTVVHSILCKCGYCTLAPWRDDHVETDGE